MSTQSGAPVRAALISGPMYDALYDCLHAFSRDNGIPVEVVFSGDHPAVNDFLESSDALACDLVSTHTKYAPSQKAILAPLDGLLPSADLSDFNPGLLDLARIDGALYGIPRNVDLRLLHYRTDLIDAVPATWDDLLGLARALSRPTLYGFAFPGKGSGLFGTFYELCESGGADLFPPDLVPQIQNEGGRWALGLLRSFYAEGLAPPKIVDWHFDEVHVAFREGTVAMVGDWPGYYADYRDSSVSPIHDRFAVTPYPTGPSGRTRVYGGSHTFALTGRGAQNEGAQALLRFLTAPEQQLPEARRGAVPVRASVMATIQAEAGPVERARWHALNAALTGILIPPKFARYPDVEEVLWRRVQEAMLGHLSIDDALEQMTAEIRAIVSDKE